MKDHKICEQIIKICQKLNAKQMLAAGDGNVSFLMEQDRVLITPRGRNKAFLTIDEFAVVDMQGRVLKGEPSTECEMHLTVYRHAKEVRAVIHAHPPCAIAWSIVNPEVKFMPTEALPEVILGIGKIPHVPYGRPGTPALAEHLKAFIKNDCRALILARHGAIAFGENLMEALNGIEPIEHAALVLHAARAFGNPQALPATELEWLLERRRRAGNINL